PPRSTTSTAFPYTTLFRSLPARLFSRVCETFQPPSVVRRVRLKPALTCGLLRGQIVARRESQRERGALPDLAFDFNGAVESQVRSEEHTSELQSRFDLVCR